MNREQFRIAVQNLRANRLRALLTTLGIIIGVASITVVLALGEGVRQAVSRQVDKLSGNVIVVKPGRSDSKALAAYSPYNTAMTTTLTERDLNTVKKIENVKDVAPVMIISGSVRDDAGRNENVPIIATSEALVDVLGLKVHSGQFIDEQTSRDTVVIGQQLAIDLFGTDEAMGQSLLVKGRPHTVIGVTKNTNTPINLSGIDLDHAAFVSLDDGKSFNQGIAQIQQLTIQAGDVNKLEQTADKIDAAILKNHGGEQDFTTLSGARIADFSSGFFTSLIVITAVVSGITLIVSGIGVMNIMLVSVTERTREIGIRKALGATDQHIMAQFLIEALIMCIVGGVLGILLAYAAAFLIGSQLFFQPSLNPYIIATGFGLALIVGIIFGLYPALKAAKKDPIEALRQYQ
jgi:putative ABC transport system permease protein